MKKIAALSATTHASATRFSARDSIAVLSHAAHDGPAREGTLVAVSRELSGVSRGEPLLLP